MVHDCGKRAFGEIFLCKRLISKKSHSLVLQETIDHHQHQTSKTFYFNTDLTHRFEHYTHHLPFSKIMSHASTQEIFAFVPDYR